MNKVILKETYYRMLKPHRNWRLKDVKNYFNITGNTTKVLNQLEQIKYFLSDD